MDWRPPAGSRRYSYGVTEIIAWVLLPAIPFFWILSLRILASGVFGVPFGHPLNLGDRLAMLGLGAVSIVLVSWATAYTPRIAGHRLWLTDDELVLKDVLSRKVVRMRLEDVTRVNRKSTLEGEKLVVEGPSDTIAFTSQLSGYTDLRDRLLNGIRRTQPAPRQQNR